MPPGTAAASGARNWYGKQRTELGWDGVGQAARTLEHLSVWLGAHQRRAEAVIFARCVPSGAALPRDGGTMGTHSSTQRRLQMASGVLLFLRMSSSVMYSPGQ